MSTPRAMTSRRSFLLAAATLAGGAGLTTGCGPSPSATAPVARSEPARGRLTLVAAAGGTDVDTAATAATGTTATTGPVVTGPRPRLVATAPGGRRATVTVRDPQGSAVTGRATRSGSRTTWQPAAPLVLGAAYTATATCPGADPATLAFSVVPAARTTAAKMMPLDGETVGVGMPVVLYLSQPVPEADRAALTGAATVEATGVEGAGVEGAWRWISATEVHWRPRQYWPAGTAVRVRVPLTQLQLGGRWGAADRDVAFTVGDSHISTADTVTHQMTTRVNGKVVKVTPISAGREGADPRFVTHSGPHVVTEKYATYFMDGATVGLSYAETVQWATRIANSGEFVHGAPWSVAQQGHQNVSHGCLNVSVPNAQWFYDLARRGDVVDVTGTGRPLELTNGLGDWTLTWEQWTAT